MIKNLFTQQCPLHGHVSVKPVMLSLAMISLLLVGCARTDAPAPVVSVNDARSPQQSSNDMGSSGSVGVVPLYPENSSSMPDSSQSAVVYQSQPYENQSTYSTPIGNGRDYTNIPKGSFSGSVYTVQPGDTLFYISWITGANVNELASLNNLSEPYSLRVGQQLSISNQVNTPIYSEPTQSSATNTVIVSTQTVPGGEPSSGGKMLGGNTVPIVPSTGAMSTGELSKVSAKGWRWPTQGQVIQGFSTADGGIKGIEIAGNQGQAVYASKAGKVVYAGNALAGYGNLIIINHDGEDLSAYAHNDTLMVSEGTEVKGGEQIATMGSSGTDRVKLYFEIRQKGVSTDPIKFLPAK
ncbi:peptidoglycan DD-metalloendopeptidase family protein [Thorsellia anophelis]|uniref:Lipoprotein NlpD n=1 Tax=Thorsellia anophelis DSM 18579 TaxID=1123402 RepID=A0A1I0CBU2_9GAMM|nr:peptidoglycan DD-metalloendopeptidase family protein [Thorsellia anophelis]SET16380.1 lipoprotein NlpD [Thorsellia anophelis DSM 18579]